MKDSAWAWFAVVILAICWVAAVLWVFFTPEPGWYDYHHAYNEHWYSSILRGEIAGARLPPGYPLVAGLLALEPVVALRLVSLSATAILAAVIYRFKGARYAALFASMPWVIVWGTRAQTDMTMAALVWSGALLATAGRSNLVGGLLVGLGAFVKPTALLAGLKANPRFLLGVGLGAIPFLAWMIYGGLDHLGFHAGHGGLFGNPIGNVFGFFAGLGLIVGLLNKERLLQADAYTMGATLLFLAFALVKAPIAHQYYLLPALIGFALAADTERPGFWAIVAMNAVLGLALLTWLSTKGGMIV